MKLDLAVIGKDVSQSDSPRIHRFILGKWGISCRYDAVSIPPAAFSAHAEALFSEYDGFNVTIPFKAEIIPYLRETVGDARVFGAVNTVLTASRAGHNTDGAGFMLMLENAGVAVAGKRALVLGAGGAGRTVIARLARAGASVCAYEEDAARLHAAADGLGCFRPLTELGGEPFDLVVNCTGIGMHDTVGQTPAVNTAEGKKPVGEWLLAGCEVAADLIYVPAESEFLRIARTLGKKTVSGGAMLFYQAYYADCLYTGRTPHAEEAKILWNDYKEENQ